MPKKLEAARCIWAEMQDRFDPELPYHRVVVAQAIVCAGNGDKRGFAAAMLWFFPEQAQEFRSLCAHHGLLERRAKPRYRAMRGGWRLLLPRKAA